VTVLLAAVLIALAVSNNAAAQPVTGIEHWVEHATLRLQVWEKFVGSPAGKPVVVLAHGSGVGGRESFDLQVPGKPSYSLMDFLAHAGFDVFAPDVRGFGRSTRPERGVTTAEAAADLDKTVDFVLKLRQCPRVLLFAQSWGTQYAGMFVMAHPDKVEKYVSSAQMHANSPDLARRRARIQEFRNSAYTSVPEAGWKRRFYSMTPTVVNDADVVEAYAKAAALAQRTVPTGPQLDMVTLMPMVNPRLITVPTMMIHGQYDDVADLAGLLPFFEQLPNPHKKYVVIPDAGHLMHLQAGHRLLQHEVANFFLAPLER
jgi:pimeloyl-ACP methyl ester carboxylesterase